MAESISISLCRPGIAAGTLWQHPVVLNELCPTSASPCHLPPLLSTVSVCPGWPHPTPTSAALGLWGTSLAERTPCFTGGFVAGLQSMPGSCTGECGNCALPSLPLTVTLCPVPAPSSPHGPQTSQTCKLNLIMRCLNALTHS